MKNIFFKVIIVIMVFSLAVAGFYFVKYQDSLKYLKDPTLATKEETAKLISQVGQLMELPKNEQPTIASVADISKLKGQEFFAKAKNGDKMLIYTGKKEIILYRPSTNKIINVAPISINNTQNQATPSATITKTTPTPVKGLVPSETPKETPVNTPTSIPQSTPVSTDTPTPSP